MITKEAGRIVTTASSRMPLPRTFIRAEGPAPAVPSSSSRRRAQGVQPATAPGAHCRSRTDEDEELARRLQEQWISEDSAGGGAGGGGGGFQVLLRVLIVVSNTVVCRRRVQMNEQVYFRG